MPDALEQAFQNGQLNFQGDLKFLAQTKIFAAWLRPLYRQDWVVYLKLPFGGAESPTIAWSPLPMAKSLFACVILLTTANRSCCPHALNKFLCRFLLHILPQGFLRIRNFGFLVNRKRA